MTPHLPPGDPSQPWIMPKAGAFPVPAGLRYHRLGRTARHRWWLPLLGTLLVLVVAFAAVLGTDLVAIIGFAVVGIPLSAEGVPENPLLEEAILLLGLATWTPLALLGAVLLQRRPARTVHSVTGRLRRVSEVIRDWVAGQLRSVTCRW